MSVPFQSLLTVRVTSPIRRKAWWITDHQRAGVARTMGDGEWSGTQRELMELLGYSSTGGVQRWLRTLYRGGIAKVYTARGHLGRTRIRFVVGVVAESMYAHVPLRKKNDDEEERTCAYIALPTTVFASWEEMRAAAGLPA